MSHYIITTEDRSICELRESASWQRTTPIVFVTANLIGCFNKLRSQLYIS